MMKRLREEKGSITLLTLGLLGVMALLFAVMLNLVKVYAVKQEASNAAQQASLAATSEIYRAVEKAIQDTDNAGLICVGSEGLGLNLWPKTIAEQIQDKKNQLSGQYTGREVELKAIDLVLTETLHDPRYFCLKDQIELELNLSTSAIQQAILDTIHANGGEQVGTVIDINHRYQVEVKTSSVYRAYKYDDWIPDNRRNIQQEGLGPELKFLEHVNWTL